MSVRRVVGSIAAFGIAGIGAVGLAAGGAAAPAQAFTGTCPTTVPAATLVADGVCEVRITTAGNFSFTPPSGITKLAAVLVGGGGGGFVYTDNSESYAGDGGSVVYIDSVPVNAPVTGSVGVGGAASIDATVNAGDGDGTTIGATSADGGTAGADGPGCYDATSSFWMYPGHGARAEATNNPACLPGPGYGLADLSGLDPALFPAAADGSDVYGVGGAATPTDPATLNPLAGGGGSVNVTQAAAGSHGLVIFRFAPAVPVTPPPAIAPTLAATGSDVPWAVPGISAAVVAAGALMLALRRRRRPAQR